MTTSKNVGAKSELTNPTTKTQSRKVKTILKNLSPEPEQIKLVQDTKPTSPTYKIVGGIMGLRRSVNIPNASPQQIVLDNDLHQELLIRGIRLKYTWDEVARAILSDHIMNNRSSDHLFPTS